MSPSSAWTTLDRLLSQLRPYRQPLSLLADALVIAWAWNLTYLFRLGFERWWTARPAYDGLVLLGMVFVYLLFFAALRIPAAMWRFTSLAEVQRLAGACLLAGLVSAVAVLMLQLQQVPRSVLSLHPVFVLAGLVTLRVAYRMLVEHMRAQLSGAAGRGRQAVVLGAGEAARLLLAGLHLEGWTVLALFDDDPAKRGARIQGVPVVGALEDVRRHPLTEDATHAITAMPGATAGQRRRAIELASAAGLKVLTVPSVSELRDGSARIERVRAIEPEDLLGRDPVQLDEAGIGELIRGKVVLVTGAGGSIGSELCRQIARYKPSRLVLYELSEFALYQIEQQLGELFPALPLVRLMGDVKQLAHLRATFAAQRPQLVFHAAAFKHVPLMEDENAWAALQNNILGTYHAALAAAEVGAERFVLISTDKAVNPTNVMGASKRAAEMVLSHLATQGHATRFVAVRFGNVLGSSGSVIPKFKAQIASGGPITVTHPEITRYFMTIPEAVQLVLQAAALAETGQVYVLDMGEPVKIVDLARDLIRLSGHRPDEIPIVFSGLRPGEKLYEELLADADQTLASAHPRLRIARLQVQVGEGWLQEVLDWLGIPPTTTDPLHHKARLVALVNEYRPEGGGAGPFR